MHDIATTNLRKLGLEKRVELVLGSAADFVLHPHERVLYLFNSFTDDILRRCLEILLPAPERDQVFKST